MRLLSYLGDSLINLLTGLGMPGKDPSVGSKYTLSMLERNDLENAYRGDWIARKIVDAPADDATREWRDWQANNDQIEQLETAEKALDVRGKTKEAIIKARLYGGAAMVMGVSQGQPWEELDPESVKEGDLKFVVVMNRYELNAGPRIVDAMSPWYTQPEYYTVATPTAGLSAEEVRKKDQEITAISSASAYAVSGIVRIHPSRIIPFVGNELPDWRLAPLGGGWGDSVLQTVDDVIKDIGMITGGIANMVNDAKMDVITIPDMSKQMASDAYTNRLLSRFMAANAAKSVTNSILIDEKEKWQRIQSNFSGLPNMLHEFLSIVAGAADIPVSRIVGQSPGHGLGAGAGSGGGDIDLRNYYDRISAQQKTVYSPRMHRFDEVLIRHATGARDESIHYEWTPLWQMSEKEKADILKVKAEATQIIVNTALINEDALRVAFSNQLIEDQAYAGLEDAIDEHGLEPDVPESRLWSPQLDPNTGLPLVAPPEPGPKLLSGPPDSVQDAAPRSLYVRRDVLNGDEIKAWAKKQGFQTTVPAEEMHVTIIYSKEAVDWMKIPSPWYGTAPDGKPRETVTVPAGGPRLLDKMGKAVALLFKSNEIEYRHQDMRRAGCSYDFEEYQPHISLTFDPGTFDWTKAEPYQGEIVLGPEIFEPTKDDESWRETFTEDAGGEVNPQTGYTAQSTETNKQQRIAPRKAKATINKRRKAPRR